MIWVLKITQKSQLNAVSYNSASLLRRQFVKVA